MKYKIKYFLIELFFKGWIPLIIFFNISSLILYKEFITIKINFKSFISQIILSTIMMYLLKGFKGLYYEYKDWYNESGLLGKIIMFLGLGFVLYGVYSRAKMSGSFKF